MKMPSARASAARTGLRKIQQNRKIGPSRKIAAETVGLFAGGIMTFGK